MKRLPFECRWDDIQRGVYVPESWHCIDRGEHTAPGFFNRVEMDNAIKALGGAWKNGAGIKQYVDHRSEVYTVRKAVWKAAGMATYGGCLCIGCLEKRIGRRLKPKDFLRNDTFNLLPGTPRLLSRRTHATRRRT